MVLKRKTPCIQYRIFLKWAKLLSKLTDLTSHSCESPLRSAVPFFVCSREKLDSLLKSHLNLT